MASSLDFALADEMKFLQNNLLCGTSSPYMYLVTRGLFRHKCKTNPRSNSIVFDTLPSFNLTIVVVTHYYKAIQVETNPKMFSVTNLITQMAVFYE